jgi:threonine/homoserine/homoserine lactone efflux protein
MQDPVVFSLAVLAILGTPGPTNTLLATSGALAGVRRSLPLIVAEVAGYLLAIATLSLLLGEVMQTHAWLRTLLRAMIALYLVHAAWVLWRRGAAPAGSDGKAIGFDRVFVTTLFNPKALVFAFGVIPLSAPDAVAYVAAFVGFVVLAALSWIFVGASVGRAAGGANGRIVPRISAVVLMLFAGLIAGG